LLKETQVNMGENLQRCGDEKKIDKGIQSTEPRRFECLEKPLTQRLLKTKADEELECVLTEFYPQLTPSFLSDWDAHY